MKTKAALLLMTRYLSARGPGKSKSFKRIRGGIMGIALSLIPLVLVYQVATGMIDGITARFMETGTFHVQAYPSSWANPEDPLENPEKAVEFLRGLKGVRYAAQEFQGMALANSDQAETGLNLRAMDPAIEQNEQFLTYMKRLEGEFDISSPGSIVLGSEVARSLKVKVGDTVRLLSSRQSAGAFFPKISRFRVTGIVSSGYQELDKLWAFVSLEAGQKVLAPGTYRSFLSISLNNPYVLPNPFHVDSDPESLEAYQKIQKAFLESWNLYTWYELQEGNYLNFVTTRNLLLFIMLLIVLIASFNVSSNMIMLVLEKQQEIAILKSLGAGAKALTFVFLGAGGICGALGAFAGLLAGSVLSLFVNELIAGLELLWNAFANLFQMIFLPGTVYHHLSLINPAHYLDRIPVHFQADFIALIFLATVLLSMAASWFPARRAGHLRPLEIMQKV